VAEEINVGSLVRHKANEGGEPLVVTSKKTEHGYIVYECRWYNGKSGSYELERFYNSELIAEEA